MVFPAEIVTVHVYFAADKWSQYAARRVAIECYGVRRNGSWHLEGALVLAGEGHRQHAAIVKLLAQMLPDQLGIPVYGLNMKKVEFNQP